jgi:transglutaminase-like putative cysteine protease
MKCSNSVKGCVRTLPILKSPACGIGLAARYVSGYLETIVPPGQEKLQGADASHAWLAVFAPGIGWIDVDPTNNCFVGNRHICTAWGRDYADVSPVKGVIFTNAKSNTMTVSVDVRHSSN